MHVLEVSQDRRRRMPREGLGTPDFDSSGPHVRCPPRLRACPPQRGSELAPRTGSPMATAAC
eukprot:7212973-Alexandrium_andersonii.AAC.1